MYKLLYLRVNYEVKITYFSEITTIVPSVTTNIIPSTGSLNFRLYMHNYVVQLVKYKKTCSKMKEYVGI